MTEEEIQYNQIMENDYIKEIYNWWIESLNSRDFTMMQCLIKDVIKIMPIEKGTNNK